jgi:hypothetical protein
MDFDWNRHKFVVAGTAAAVAVVSGLYLLFSGSKAKAQPALNITPPPIQQI